MVKRRVLNLKTVLVCSVYYQSVPEYVFVPRHEWLSVRLSLFVFEFLCLCLTSINSQSFGVYHSLSMGLCVELCESEVCFWTVTSSGFTDFTTPSTWQVHTVNPAHFFSAHLGGGAPLHALSNQSNVINISKSSPPPCAPRPRTHMKPGKKIWTTLTCIAPFL